MNNNDLYPHFDFNFKKIRNHWKLEIGNYVEAVKYLRVVDKRLDYWLQECEPWIDFDFAMKRLEEDVNLRDAENHLTWLALRRRAKLANEQRKRRSHSVPMKEGSEMGILIKVSRDGTHDAVWHEDFRNIYKRAMRNERKELRKLKETGNLPARGNVATHNGSKASKASLDARPTIQWLWANRLLAYLFETLLEKEAICAEDGMWAALDGVFADRRGKPITRKDLALWAHQYHNNKACAEESGKPKKRQAVDGILQEISG